MASLILGAGFIGAALAQRLCAAGERIVAADNGFATDWSALERLREWRPEQLTLLRADIREATAVEDAFRAASVDGPVRAVYLLAAQASAHADAAPAEYTEETNLRGPRLVLEAAARHGAPPVVYGSSFHVYGAGLTGEVDEARPYGAFRDLSHLSKVYAEKLGELFAAQYGVPFAAVRLGIIYGLGPVVKHDPRFVTVPHAFALRVVHGESLRVNETGLSPMGFVHLDDAVLALRAAVVLARNAVPSLAIGNAVGEVATVVDVARAVARAGEARGLRAVIDVPGEPAQPMPGAAFSVASRLTALGWRPSRRLEDEVGAILDYYTAHASGRQPVEARA